MQAMNRLFQQDAVLVASPPSFIPREVAGCQPPPPPLIPPPCMHDVKEAHLPEPYRVL